MLWISCRTYCLLALFLLAPYSYAFGQGKLLSQQMNLTADSKDLEDLSSTLVAFVNTCNSLPTQFAACVRGHLDELKDSEAEGFVADSVDFVIIDCKSENRSLYTRGTQTVESTNKITYLPMVWDNVLTLPDGRYRRIGFHDKLDGKAMVGEDGSLSGQKDAKLTRRMQGVSFLNLPVADMGAMLAGQVGNSFVYRLLEADLVLAGQTDKTKVGVWRFPSALVTITFNEKNLPIESRWRCWEGSLEETRKSGRDYSVTKTTWVEIGGFAVPRRVQIAAPGSLKQSPHHEADFICDYRFDEEQIREAFPRLEALDWLTGFELLFEQDVGQSFSEYKESVMRR